MRMKDPSDIVLFRSFKSQILGWIFHPPNWIRYLFARIVRHTWFCAKFTFMDISRWVALNLQLLVSPALRMQCLQSIYRVGGRNLFRVWSNKMMVMPRIRIFFCKFSPWRFRVGYWSQLFALWTKVEPWPFWKVGSIFFRDVSCWIFSLVSVQYDTRTILSLV